MSETRDEFLSEADLDLANLSDEELEAWRNLWLDLAQATNDLDAALYSHGVFERDPAPRRFGPRGAWDRAGTIPSKSPTGSQRAVRVRPPDGR